MGFQWPGRYEEPRELEGDHSRDLQRITAIPREPTCSILQGCILACEAMNRDWEEMAPEIGGKWVCAREENHCSIFFLRAPPQRFREESNVFACMATASPGL